MLKRIILLRALQNYRHPSGGWGGGSEDVLLTTSRLVQLHCTLRLAHVGLQRSEPVTKQKVTG